MTDHPTRQPSALSSATSGARAFTLPWPAPLVRGTLVRRYDRFLADVALDDGAFTTAHCVNTGAMEGLVVPGAPVWLSPASSAARKLRWTWSAIELDGIWVGVDTSLPNRLVRAMLGARALEGLDTWETLLPEHAHARGSRVDFRLVSGSHHHDIEVKNCHLVYPDGYGYFPDSVSERATKHLTLLARAARRGEAATVLFVVQRVDVVAVRPSDVHDLAFAKAARRAAGAGVRFRALRVGVDRGGVTVWGEVPVDLRPYGLAAPGAWRAAARSASGWQRGPRKT